MSVVAVVLICLGLLGLGLWLWTRAIANKAVATVPQAGQILAVAGGAIHYIDEGPKDATPLVLIHGLSGNLHHFTHSLTRRLASEFRVICLDRPGTGYSTVDDDDLAMLPAQAKMIGEFLDRLGVKKPVLVGHSLGGTIALAMALDNKDKIAALALLCPLTQVIPEPPAVFKPLLIRSRILRRLIGHTVAVPIAHLTMDRALRDVCAPEPVPQNLLIGAGINIGMRPEGYVSASADLVGATRSLPAQAARYETELKTPGGILFGADDAILSPELHGHSMEPHGLFCEILPGRGHMIPITAAEECASFIKKVAERAQR